MEQPGKQAKPSEHASKRSKKEEGGVVVIEGDKKR
jgi:hypothetical protein